MMFINIYFKIKNYLITVFIQKLVRSFFDKNTKVIEKMKDEAVGMVIKEFIGLRSKMCSYEINNETTKKCKGISKHSINKDITIDDYRDTQFYRKKALYEIN